MDFRVFSLVESCSWGQSSNELPFSHAEPGIALPAAASWTIKIHVCSFLTCSDWDYQSSYANNSSQLMLLSDFLMIQKLIKSEGPFLLNFDTDSGVVQAMSDPVSHYPQLASSDREYC